VIRKTSPEEHVAQNYNIACEYCFLEEKKIYQKPKDLLI
jgi:hypothetical protein